MRGNTSIGADQFLSEYVPEYIVIIPNSPFNRIGLPMKKFSSNIVRVALATLIALGSVCAPSGIIAHSGGAGKRAVHPNPFKVDTTFQLTIPETSGESRIKIDVYDILGKHVRNLFGGESGQPHAPGENMPIYWDGKDKYGELIPPGVYICVLFSDGHPIKSVKVIKIEA